jgi:hypothetical protein
MMLYFDSGIPEGHDTVIDGAVFDLEPKLVSLHIDTGTVGGSLIIATVEGVGINSFPDQG